VTDRIAVSAVILSFAVLCTAHLAIAAGLLRRSPRWRALVGLVALPLAPYWAARERMWLRAAFWCAGLIGYVIARVAAS